MCAVPAHPPPSARPAVGFLKPSSDDEESGSHNSSVPTCKKSSKPACESDSVEKPPQEKESGAGKAAQDGVQGDKAAEATSRFKFFICLF